MKTNWFLYIATVIYSSATTAFSQTSAPHQFSGITATADHAISLALTSAVPSGLRNYYDLFPIEASPDFIEWQPLITLVRTNSSTNNPLYLDSAAAVQTKRFYRTPPNQLITPIPQPIGPYAVGTTSRLFTDPSRTNRYNIRTNSSFMVQFWYPAAPKAGVLPAAYLDRRIATTWYGYYSHFGISGSSTLFNNACSHALPDVRIATNQASYPVVIFTHGYQCIRTMDTDVMENLASDGYIAVAIDHSDAWVSIFPDGRVVQGNASDLPISNAQQVFNLRSRTSDVRFVMDELIRLNQEDDFFRGRLDLQHVGIFGHSFGGAIAADACAGDNRFKAGLSLDGGGHTNLLALRIAQPFLIASGADADSVMQPFRAGFRSLFDQHARDAYWFRLKNSEHFEFVESPWLASSPVPSKLRSATILRAYILSFFNKYLKGRDDHLLDGPSPDYPEVDAFLKK